MKANQAAKTMKRGRTKNKANPKNQQATRNEQTKMKLKLLVSLILLACSATLFAMGAWGAMYKGIDDLADEIRAWNIECSSKPNDADCARNAASLKKQAEKMAQWADSLAADGGASWRLAARIVRYHGNCSINPLNPTGSRCADEYNAIYKERMRIRRDDSPLSYAGWFYTDRDAVKWLLGSNPNIKRPTP